MQLALKAETGKTKDRLNGGRNYSSQRQSSRRQQKTANRARTLESEASTALRDQLIAELKDLNSAEQAADWAHRALAAKNRLVVADAEQVELAFQLKLSAFMADQPKAVEHAKGLRTPAPRGQSRATNIDKMVLALPAARRIRDREHVSSVAKQATLPGLRSTPCRRASSAICTVTRAWPQGQRRVHYPTLPGTPSRGPSLW